MRGKAKHKKKYKRKKKCQSIVRTRENEMKTLKKKPKLNKTNFVVLMFLVHINFHKKTKNKNKTMLVINYWPKTLLILLQGLLLLLVMVKT